MFLRPDPATLRRNRAFLELCLGSTEFTKLQPLVDDLLKLDTGSWCSHQIVHHCSGLFCCRSIEETRLKLENAIVVPWMKIYVLFLPDVFFCVDSRFQILFSFALCTLHIRSL